VSGVERYGSSALLRSVAVDPQQRCRGHATLLVARALEHARDGGAEETYLLTETAEGFFRRFGFAPIPRALAPSSIQSAREFVEQCPETAVLMRRLEADAALPKVYLAASIRGGRGEAALYQKIIDSLRPHARILTEHLADPELDERGESANEDEWIFGRDLEWLREADALIAEVTVPSLGVGYELARAEDLGLPILCLFRQQNERALSAMVRGNPALLVADYRKPDQAIEAALRFVDRVRRSKGRPSKEA
jgi:hypothetical protein